MPRKIQPEQSSQSQSKATATPNDFDGANVVAELAGILARYEGGKQNQLLPLLHEIQEAVGYIPRGVVPLMAHRLLLSRAEVHGVLSYYNYFRQQAPGKHVLRICRAESCRGMGGEQLAAAAEQELGCGFNHTSNDGTFSLESVHCLGLCAASPAVQVDELELHANMDTKSLLELIRDLRSKS